MVRIEFIGAYRPLPEELTLKESLIEGWGVHAVQDIPTRTVLGITHVEDSRFPDGLIRTPLGGYLNHSTESNSKLVRNSSEKWWELVTTRDIQIGEEITLNYSQEECGKNYFKKCSK